MSNKPTGHAESHDIRGPRNGTAAMRAIEAIHHAGRPLTIDEGIAITGKFYDTLPRHTRILDNCVTAGWLDCVAGRYSLTPAITALMGKKHFDAPKDEPAPIVPPPYRPVYNVEYQPAPHPRAAELRDMSFKTGSCGSNSIYWSQAA